MPNKIVFKNPPIEELVFGVQFNAPILTNQIIFEYYSTKKKDFPKSQELIALPSVIEKDDIVIANPGVKTRQLFFSSEDNRLIQLQGDRILFNWRKAVNRAAYPHFDVVFKEFTTILEEVINFVNFKDTINQVEITYLDHIPLSDFGLEDYNLSEMFKSGMPYNFKHVQNVYKMAVPKLNGALHMKINSATKSDDPSVKLIALNTICRGMFGGGTTFDGWYNEAHLLIRNLFLEIITPKAKKTWGMEVTT